jgi:hypothetical protein
VEAIRWSEDMSQNAGRFTTIAPWKRVLMVLLLATPILIAWLVMARSPLRPLDFEHYRTASSLIWRGVSPYKQVEFFAPPWFAALLGPLNLLPLNLAAAVWLVASVLSVIGSAAIAMNWVVFPSGSRARQFLLLVCSVLPASLYVYLTGQSSALVAAAILGFGWIVAAGEEGRKTGWLVAAVVALTFKPHLVVLPVALGLLELIRRRAWRPLAMCAGGLITLGGLSFLLLPTWPQDWLAALVSGEFYGGPHLVAVGYAGLRELGVPGLLLVPLAIYALLVWWRQGLTTYAMALALCANLILVPYSRAYDGVLLYFPALVVLARTTPGSRWIAALLALAALLIVPVGNFVLSAPMLVAIGLLLTEGADAPSSDAGEI